MTFEVARCVECYMDVSHEVCWAVAEIVGRINGRAYCRHCLETPCPCRQSEQRHRRLLRHAVPDDEPGQQAALRAWEDSEENSG